MPAKGDAPQTHASSAASGKKEVMVVVGERSKLLDFGGPTLVVHSNGPVTTDDRAYGEHAIEIALALSPMSVPFAELELRIETEPASERPALARVTVTHEGRSVSVHADAPTITDAVEMLGLRLRRRLEKLYGLHA